MNANLIVLGALWGSALMLAYTVMRSRFALSARRTNRRWLGALGAGIGLVFSLSCMLLPLSWLDRPDYASWFPGFVIGAAPWMPWAVRKSAGENW